MTPDTILQEAYHRVTSEAFSIEELTEEEQAWVKAIVAHAESQKAVLAALLTSLVKKMETPTQDTRYHKVEMAGGYSGRGFDTHYVTPFLREKFPRLAMKSGSGWLTRSIEQNYPFTLDFPGKIQNGAVKQAFLRILNDIEVNGGRPERYLYSTLRELHQTVHQGPSLVHPTIYQGTLTRADLVGLLEKHFFHQYAISGASRLPALGIYAIYQMLMEKMARYQGMKLVPMKSHTTSDLKSGSYGDIEVTTEQDTLFEAVEIKHGIAITPTMVTDAYEKFASTPINTYYLSNHGRAECRREDDRGCTAKHRHYPAGAWL